MASLGVLTAIANPALEAVVVGALGRQPGELTVVRRCVEMADVLALAASGAAGVVLVDESFSGIDPDVVDQIAGYGVTVVAIAQPDDRWPGERRIAATVDAGLEENALVAAIQRATRNATPASTSTNPIPAVPTRLGGSRGQVIAVWGPTGAPGRTTLALGLADAVARSGVPALLVDADVYGGSCAVMLGLLDEAPGIAAACRAASASGFDPIALARTCLQVGPSLRVLTGISRSDRWPELRPRAMETVLATARSLAAVTVIDCGFSIEQDDELVYDTMAPQRNAATIATLESADQIVVVCGGDPVSVVRGVRAVQDVRELVPAARLRLVVNKVRRGAFHGDPAPQLADSFERFVDLPIDAILPWDDKACDTAMLRGRTLAEVAPSSVLVRRIAELAGSLTGYGVVRGRRSRQRAAG